MCWIVDRVVGTPARPAVHRRHERYGNGSASSEGDLFQKKAGKETDPPAIGREKRIVGTLRSRKQYGLALVELSREEMPSALAIGDVHDLLAIGRNRDVRSNAIRRDGCFRRQRDRKARHRKRGWIRAAR